MNIINKLICFFTGHRYFIPKTQRWKGYMKCARCGKDWHSKYTYE